MAFLHFEQGQQKRESEVITRRRVDGIGCNCHQLDSHQEKLKRVGIH